MVTGGSRGIGRALARALSARGVRVIVTGRRGAELDAVVRAGDAWRGVVLDAGDTKASVATLRELDRALGGLDLVIANAGVGIPDPEMTPYAWEAIAEAMHVNVCGAAATLTAVLPDMVSRGRGHAVAIGSLAAFGALPGAAAYSAPKAALAMLMDCLRLDLAGTGVTATTVHLGFVRTRMVERSAFPMPQLLEPGDAAERIVTALARRPRTITLPRALAAAAWGAALLPSAVKERVARHLR